MGADYYFEADVGGKERIEIADGVYFTYNLGPMFREAYPGWEWRMIAEKQLKDIEPLMKQIRDTLLSDPPRFEKLNPSNGWGSYEAMLEGINRILEYCERMPEAWVRAWL